MLVWHVLILGHFLCHWWTVLMLAVVRVQSDLSFPVLKASSTHVLWKLTLPSCGAWMWLWAFSNGEVVLPSSCWDPPWGPRGLLIPPTEPLPDLLLSESAAVSFLIAGREWLGEKKRQFKSLCGQHCTQFILKQRPAVQIALIPVEETAPSQLACHLGLCCLGLTSELHSPKLQCLPWRCAC